MNEEEIYNIKQQITMLLRQNVSDPALALNILLECTGSFIALAEFISGSSSLLNLSIKGISEIRDKSHEALKGKTAKQ